MKKYKVTIVPQKFISYGKDEEEAIKQVLKHLEDYKEMFVVEEVEENGED